MANKKEIGDEGMRNIRRSEKLLVLGLSIILIFMIIQDWVPLGSLNDVQAIHQAKSSSELITTTLIGVVQFLLLLGLVLIFIGKRYPIWARLWLVIHQLSIFIGVLFSWYLPYFLGYKAEEKVEEYREMFADTHSFLPEMNGIVPNTFHVVFHLTLLFSIVLSIYISLTNNKENSKIYKKAS